MVRALFKLLRWPNLLMIVAVQYLLRLAFIEALDLPHVLNHWQFALGVLTSVLLAAGGYIINDLYDLENDRINKPERMVIGSVLSEDRAWNLYFGSVIGAVLAGYFVAQASGIESLWMIPPLAVVLLYLYAYQWKKLPLVGNLLIALLAALPVFLVGIYDLLPAANYENAATVRQSLEVVAAYAGFAFISHLLRELVKDAQDRKGDAALGFKTLALSLSPKLYKAIVYLVWLLLFVPLAYYSIYLWNSDPLSAAYLLLSLIAPLLYFAWALAGAQKASDFGRLSGLLKWVMLAGMLSIAVFTLVTMR